MDKLFFLLGGIMFLDFFIFLFVAKWHKYRENIDFDKPMDKPKDMQALETDADNMKIKPDFVDYVFIPDSEVTKL